MAYYRHIHVSMAKPTPTSTSPTPTTGAETPIHLPQVSMSSIFIFLKNQPGGIFWYGGYKLG